MRTEFYYLFAAMELQCTERKKWSRNGSRVEPFSCPQDGPHLGTVLVSSEEVKGKNRSTFKKWSRFPKQLQGGAILAPLFFSVCNSIISVLLININNNQNEFP